MHPRNKSLVFAMTATLAMFLCGNAAITASRAPMVFASPQRAVESLVAALRSSDDATLRTILGPDGTDILYSGDAVADNNARKIFIAAYDTHSDLAPRDATHMVLNVGTDEWPMPIPIVKQGSGWRFDTEAGRHELLARRIGRNELDAIQSCLAYVDAQRDYASVDRGDGRLDYARRFVSTPGKHDGLYWPTKAGAAESPLGPLFASARAQGYWLDTPKITPTPFHGYLFRILDRQGPAADGGAYDYLVNGRMIGGFALLAYPASYGVSGTTTFIVNQDGVVFQKDLGPKTAALAWTIAAFNPDESWTKVPEKVAANE